MCNNASRVEEFRYMIVSGLSVVVGFEGVEGVEVNGVDEKKPRFVHHAYKSERRREREDYDRIIV